MPLTLNIENKSSLPDGGPLSFTMLGRTRADIGRDQYLDWSLPDPERFISGKHCEIRYQDNEYLLVDVSTNGTFVNGAAARVQSPYRLKHGDRLQIGEYLIVVSVTGEGASGFAEAASIQIDRPSSYDLLWDASGDIPQPIDPKHLRPPQRAQPIYGEFLYHAADVPRVSSSAQFSPAEDVSLDWAPVVAKREIQEAPVRMPEPRRPPSRSVAWDSDVEPKPAAEWSAPSSSPDAVAEPVATAPISAASISEPLVEAPPMLAPVPVSVPRVAEPRPVPSPPMPAAASATPASTDAFMEAFAAAAGISRATLTGRTPQELGTLLGGLVLSVTENMQHLLQARSHAKQVARSAEHTVIQPQDNNPLKFTPSPQDALRIMLGPATRSYLDATHAVSAGFSDLKQHQARSLSGMQGALLQTLEALDPATLQAVVDKGGSASTVFRSRKAALWDAYVAAWEDVSKGGREGTINQFMIRFGEIYDKAGNRS